jgi:N-acyl-D-amino-acid deacylase
VGAFADLVVFDPLTVADTATFDDPQRFATGLDCVIVNGGVQLLGGEASGTLHGRVLRLGRDAG